MEHIDNPLEAAIEQRARETAACRRDRKMAVVVLGGIAAVTFVGVLTFARLPATRSVGAVEQTHGTDVAAPRSLATAQGQAQHPVIQASTEAPMPHGGARPTRAPQSWTEATQASLRPAGPTRSDAIRVRRAVALRRGGQVATIVPRSSPAPTESHQSP